MTFDAQRSQRSRMKSGGHQMSTYETSRSMGIIKQEMTKSMINFNAHKERKEKADAEHESLLK